MDAIWHGAKKDNSICLLRNHVCQDEVLFSAFNALCILSFTESPRRRNAFPHACRLIAICFTPYASHPPCLISTFHDMVSSNWNRHWKSCLLCYANCSSLFAFCLLLLSEDVEANPGPGPCYPCGSCAKSFCSNQPDIYCEVCYFWYHTKYPMRNSIIESTGRLYK